MREIKRNRIKIKVPSNSRRDASERAGVASTTAQPTKFFLVNGEELVDHEVDHILYTYVQNDGVLEPSTTFYRAAGDIYVLVRTVQDLAELLVDRHMCLWHQVHEYARNPYMRVGPHEAHDANPLRRKHHREGQELASMIASAGYFDTPTENLCIKAWNIQVVLPRTVVVQRIITHWLQCVRIIQHPCHPSAHQVWLRPAHAIRYYTRGVPALWPLQIAELCLGSVLHGWRQQLTNLQDKMLYRALNKKMVKLARSTIRYYARKLMPLCHALDDFLSCRTFTFDRWLIERLNLQGCRPSTSGKEPCFKPRPAWAHRMNLWVR